MNVQVESSVVRMRELSNLTGIRVMYFPVTAKDDGFSRTEHWSHSEPVSCCPHCTVLMAARGGGVVKRCIERPVSEVRRSFCVID